MYQFVLLIGVVFCLYIVTLTTIVVKKSRRNRRDSVNNPSTSNSTGMTPFQPQNIADTNLAVVVNAELEDNNGITILKWHVPDSVEYIESRVYYRPSNNAAAAQCKFKIPYDETGHFSVEHDRRGFQFWYWVSLQLLDGSETERFAAGTLLGNNEK